MYTFHEASVCPSVHVQALYLSMNSRDEPQPHCNQTGIRQK